MTSGVGHAKSAAAIVAGNSSFVAGTDDTLKATMIVGTGAMPGDGSAERFTAHGSEESVVSPFAIDESELWIKYNSDPVDEPLE
jgi:hypothetical protein